MGTPLGKLYLPYSALVAERSLCGYPLSWLQKRESLRQRTRMGVAVVLVRRVLIPFLVGGSKPLAQGPSRGRLPTNGSISGSSTSNGSFV